MKKSNSIIEMKELKDMSQTEILKLIQKLNKEVAQRKKPNKESKKPQKWYCDFCKRDYVKAGKGMHLKTKKTSKECR